MRAPGLAICLAVALAGCGDDSGGGGTDGGGARDGGRDGAASMCVTPCSAATVCRYGACVPPPSACTKNLDCAGDRYCDVGASECLPWDVGPGGSKDPTCTRAVVPGVFFPGAQCEWLGPKAGEPFPNHKNVLGTPMVATFGGGVEFSHPSIVFISYNGTDGGNASCVGTSPAFTGVIRVIDGRNCALQASISTPVPIAATSVALADLDGDGTPEIIAQKVGGGLAAWKYMGPGRFDPLWSSASTFNAGVCNWTGPSVHDLDDDGVPEILMEGAVFDARGNLLNTPANAAGVGATSLQGYIPVVADVERTGKPELVTGTGIYSWDATAKAWTMQHPLSAPGAHIAVADLGTYPMNAAMDDRATRDGIAEVVAVAAGVATVFNIHGRVLYQHNIPPENEPVYDPVTMMVGRGVGGPPTIADFDGDGRAEFATAGGKRYSVFDLDCLGTPDPRTCPTMTTTGVLWSQPSQDLSSNTTGSSVFDFEGDGPAEAVYGDECFTRVYQGATGRVMYSRYRTSCTWYENPVVADVDGDFSAEIVVTSNTNCSVACPAMDPIFDGVNCFDDSDCPSPTRCKRELPADKLGRCRCNATPDCGGDGFVCLDPIAGPSSAGKVCRASNPGPATAFGVRVIADRLDRWVNTRRIWNQHAYAVTNIDDQGRVPRTSLWARNWDTAGLNNFRQNSPGLGAGQGLMADLTARSGSFQCVGTAIADLSVDVCDRGTKPVADGLSVAIYPGAPGGTPVCVAKTTMALHPGQCERVTCTGMAPTPAKDFSARADDDGTGSGQNTECREDNNTATIAAVGCP